MKLAVLLTWSALLAAAAPGAARAAPPNLVVIMVDDLNVYAELPAVSTPHMDALAARGVRFTRAYAAHPACTPARVSLLAGQLTHRTEVVLNGVVPPVGAIHGVPYLPCKLRAAGYHSASAGKVFHAPQPVCFDEVHWASDDPWIVKPTLPHAPWASGMVIGGPFLNGPTGALGKMKDTKETDRTLALLAEGKQRLATTGQPFAIWLGLVATHDPLVYPEKFGAMYAPADVPPLPPQDLFGAWKAGVNPQSWTTHWFYDPQWAATEEERRIQACLAYFRCISYIDEEIGRVLAALSALDLDDDTIVVLISDHGWSFSEHAHIGKTRGFDEDVLAPLVIAAPTLPATHGQVVTTPVSHVDLYPTLMDLMGLVEPGPLDGASLVPQLHDVHAARGPVFFTVDEEYAFHLTRYVVKRHAASGEIWKLGAWENDASIPQVNQLYNLSVDPHEFDNRHLDAQLAPLVAELRADLHGVGLLGPGARRFGHGVAGAAGVPALSLSAPPALGGSALLEVGSSSGSPAPGLVLVGLDGKDPNKYGLALVPQVTQPILLGASGASVPVTVPALALFHEVPVGIQVLQLDAAAKNGIAASRGLALFLSY